MLVDVIERFGGKEVTAMDVYGEMFKLGEGVIQKEWEEPGLFKSNPIFYFKNDDEEQGHYRIGFEDTFEDVLKEAQAADFAVIGGCSYFGRRNVQSAANKLHALMFDLDDLDDDCLHNFLFAAINGAGHHFYPVPNYVILSGHGVHLYYIFEEPVPLYPNIKIQLKDLKYKLIRRIWNPNNSLNKSPQFQGINQGFRVIGGKTKKGAPEPVVRAFEINPHPVSLTYLCEFIPEAFAIDESKFYPASKMTLKLAKRMWPEWYERVVVNGEQFEERIWDISGKVHGSDPYALYHWWIRRLEAEASYGHRYFGIMCLAIYAIKCGVPFEQLQADAMALIPTMNDVKDALEPFTEDDVNAALECFDLRFAKFPLDTISALSGIRIEKNKRNGRPQVIHMQIARATCDILHPNGSWRLNNGRKSKEELVKAYIADHPDQTVAAMARELGVSRTTIYKYKAQ